MHNNDRSAEVEFSAWSECL